MQITVNIEKSLYGGNTLAFYNKKAIFIPYAIPGETVQIEIIDKKKDYDLAIIKKIISPSPDRINPECPNFTICGGCSYLHMNYKRELKEKTMIIEDNLIRISGFSTQNIPKIETLSKNRFYYRSHAQVKKENNTNSGFYQKNSHKIIPFPKHGCRLLNQAISNQIFKLDTTINNNFKIALDTQKNCIYSSSADKIVKELLYNIKYTRNIFSFFQANHFLRPEMLKKVESYALPLTNKNILDIGCGIGFFSLYLARKCKKITGYDINKNSIDFAIKNCKINNISNAKFIAKKSALIHSYNNKSDIIIIDPPRAGLDKKTRSIINSISPEKIIYISCNPSTWARDIKDFTKNNYSLSKLSFIDMFPCTCHIEIISLLQKEN